MNLSIRILHAKQGISHLCEHLDITSRWPRFQFHRYSEHLACSEYILVLLRPHISKLQRKLSPIISSPILFEYCSYRVTIPTFPPSWCTTLDWIVFDSVYSEMPTFFCIHLFLWQIIHNLQTSLMRYGRLNNVQLERNLLYILASKSIRVWIYLVLTRL